MFVSVDATALSLHDVTFVVFDLETTGVAADAARITEIGGVKIRGGEILGTFESLVDPQVPISPFVESLTGISDRLVRDAPRLGAIWPAWLEFIGDAALVGHNVGFDLAFSMVACDSLGYVPRPPTAIVDTLALARLLLDHDEIADHRLATLAEHLRVAHRPCHRAFADAQATVDVFHALLERLGSLGVDALDDLVAFPTLHRQAVGHLRLVRPLARRPAVLMFRDRFGRVLHLTPAMNGRATARCYLSAGASKRARQLLRATGSIDSEVTETYDDAIRLAEQIERQDPPRWRRGRWVPESVDTDGLVQAVDEPLVSMPNDLS